ncbi:MAG: type III pantothenate kinase [Phycisphaerales bacterium]|nr:type III pantothenate kinase [Phycisphaerales bacterium]
MPRVETADALLAVDIGNTRIALGVWDSDGLHDAQRVEISRPDAWQATFESAWAAVGGSRRALVIGSVNPRETRRVQDALEGIAGVEALRVRDDLPLPMPLEIDNPDEVGVDRVCSAAAAHERIGGACAVASFGTALTVDCVSPEGRFLGGVILPGLDMSYRALHTQTAQLPLVTVERPNGVFGRNTHDAIVSGVTYGLLGALREIVERFASDLREWPQLVLTGGNAPMMAELAEFVDSVVPDLCLMGVALAYRRAAGQP